MQPGLAPPREGAGVEPLAGGLTDAEAARRLEAYGRNELTQVPAEPLVARAATKLREPMSLLLVTAAAIAGLVLGEALDASVIVVVVIVNATIALAQEEKAGRALAALESLDAPTARVLRGGRAQSAPASELVPGDLVLLAAGDRVPADVRLVETSAMEVDESLLTGESLPVLKDAAAGERATLAFSGTILTRGSGRGEVFATGDSTALGAIARRMQAPARVTPLQEELGRVTRVLGVAALAVAAGVFVLGLVAHGSEGIERSLLAAVALAVAAVPEGLASVVTVALALGVRRMARQGAIVRVLPAVETLGSTDVILTDKTGTLTENRMRLATVAVPGRDQLDPPGAPAAAMLLEAGALCNDASLDPPAGDPLEVALLEAARLPLADRLQRVDATPFDSERKMMSTLHRTAQGFLLVVKGAPEAVVARSTRLLLPDGSTPALDDAGRAATLSRAARMADRGMRVLAFARKDVMSAPSDLVAAEHGLTFLGLGGLSDPARPEAAAAVEEAQGAGIDLVMVTGDHPGTAGAIAAEVGILQPGGRVSTATDDPAQVYARVDPADKLSLVEDLQARGHVVAVTGDGVNDAPALKAADIGVAMGRSGTAAARESADLVITDDNLATIVTAVRQGRGIYANVRKVVDYLVGANLAEVIVVVTCLVAFPGLGVPLLPIQLLWINLLTDGLPALALGVDPIDPRVMSRGPRHRGVKLLDAPGLRRLAARAAVLATAALAALAVARYAWDAPWPHARSLMFTVLATSQLFYAFAVRVPARVTSNAWLLGGVVGGLLLQVAVVIVPAARDVFGTSSLSTQDWALTGGLSILPALVVAAEARSGPRD